LNYGYAEIKVQETIMAILYEYHNTGDDSAVYIGISTGAFYAQTFTPVIAHTITSIKLLMYRAAGTPGIITVRIKAVDGSGHPTGPDLATGTTDGDTLTENTAGEWREIALGVGFALSVGVMYAFLPNAAVVTFPNTAYMRWRNDGVDGYTVGRQEYTSNGGTSWSDSEIATTDIMFEDWGDPAFKPWAIVID